MAQRFPTNPDTPVGQTLYTAVLDEIKWQLGRIAIKQMPEGEYSDVRVTGISPDEDTNKEQGVRVDMAVPHPVKKSTTIQIRDDFASQNPTYAMVYRFQALLNALDLTKRALELGNVGQAIAQATIEDFPTIRVSITSEGIDYTANTKAPKPEETTPTEIVEESKPTKEESNSSSTEEVLPTLWSEAMVYASTVIGVPPDPLDAEARERVDPLDVGARELVAAVYLHLKQVGGNGDPNAKPEVIGCLRILCKDTTLAPGIFDAMHKSSNPSVRKEVGGFLSRGAEERDAIMAKIASKIPSDNSNGDVKEDSTESAPTPTESDPTKSSSIEDYLN